MLRGALGHLDGDRIADVVVCGEPPWSMTKYHGEEYILILQSTAETYEEARNGLRSMYPAYMPKLAARLPFPE